MVWSATNKSANPLKKIKINAFLLLHSCHHLVGQTGGGAGDADTKGGQDWGGALPRGVKGHGSGVHATLNTSGKKYIKN